MISRSSITPLEFGVLLRWRDGKNAESPQTARERTRNWRVSSFARESELQKSEWSSVIFGHSRPWSPNAY